MASHHLGVVTAPVPAQWHEIRRDLPFGTGWAGRMLRIAAKVMDVRGSRSYSGRLDR
jgi:hypothetical protein